MHISILLNTKLSLSRVVCNRQDKYVRYRKLISLQTTRSIMFWLSSMPLGRKMICFYMPGFVLSAAREFY